MSTAELSLEPTLGGLPSERRPGVATGYAILGALAFLSVWSGFAALVFEPYVLPPPWAVAARMWEFTTSGLVLAQFWASLWKTLLGWILALVLGIPIGISMGRFRYAKAFFHDLVYLAANVPLIVYAVLSLILFGISSIGPAVVVMLLVLPAVAMNVAAGVESVDRGLLAMSRSFRRPSDQVARNVIIPSVIPFLFAGGRVSFATSWKLEALTETFGGTIGVGFQLQKAFHTFSVVSLLAWMMFFVLFVILVERVILVRLERRLFAWRSPAAGTGR
ncbi:MAG TPA: ABC transporter permease subunit [Acidimicrobiia bacterium]|nr:ABC transporter permease subunit [Acidimicrobiia bacterium]